MIAVAALVLSIGAWPQRDNAAFPAAIHYKLRVRGAPYSAAQLRGSIDPGWLVTFCTANLCAPGQVRITIPRSGVAIVDLQAIRLAGDAPRSTEVHVASNTARVSAAVRVPRQAIQRPKQ